MSGVWNPSDYPMVRTMAHRNTPPVCWTHSFRRIVDVIGEDAAQRLIKAFGGNDWYIPKKPNPDHRFVSIIGLPAFRALCAAFAKEHIDIPRHRETSDMKWRILAATGTNYEVAVQMGCTVRHVRRVRAEVRRVS